MVVKLSAPPQGQTGTATKWTHVIVGGGEDLRGGDLLQVLETAAAAAEHQAGSAGHVAGTVGIERTAGVDGDGLDAAVLAPPPPHLLRAPNVASLSHERGRGTLVIRCYCCSIWGGVDEGTAACNSIPLVAGAAAPKATSCSKRRAGTTSQPVSNHLFWTDLASPVGNHRAIVIDTEQVLLCQRSVGILGVAVAKRRDKDDPRRRSRHQRVLEQGRQVLVRHVVDTNLQGC